MIAEFPNLFQFLAGYFHQDWSSDHEAEDDVVRSFVAEASPETVSRVKGELQLVLRTLNSEEEMQVFLFEEMGCSYYFPSAWSSGKVWLEHVAALL
jgi:hypothetical protein